MPLVTPINAPPEPSSLVLMVTGLVTMGIYFLATRKHREAAANKLETAVTQISRTRPSHDELLQTELEIESDLASIQGMVKDLQIEPLDQPKADQKANQKDEATTNS